MSETIRYLQMLRDKLYQSEESLPGLVLKYGHTFTRIIPCPVCYQGQPKLCFNNAALAVLNDPRRYAYVEGYSTSVIPVDHAWVYDRWEQAIFDPTWLRPDMAQTDPAEYVGLMFRSNYLRRYVHRQKQAALLMGDPLHARRLMLNPKLRRRALILPPPEEVKVLCA